MVPHTDFVNTFTARVTDTIQGRSFELSAEVRLTEILESYTYGDKLVEIANAGRTQAVVVFDLLRRQEIDWFVCYGPTRIAPDKIASMEWFPQFAEIHDSVLLIYDLAKSPVENRLGSRPGLRLPPPVMSTDDSIVDVGIPIYPEWNARQKSYEISGANSGPPIWIQMSSLVLLPSQKLVFVVTENIAARDPKNYLVLTDLSNGAAKATSKKVDIPKDRVKKFMDNNRNYVKIERIEPISATRLLLHVREDLYGVSSITVDVP